ncbi:hypothetical protein J437_LFUL016982 [Ladona fulva]|uniref:Uncharacterized protein n=1 Tax=Ladona fulva TaxID=123851 RepID=A0A8K0KNM7_LADFU|nr:hypothetical protein J437_LFUL016982 [Ladona fulva]
MRSNVSSDNDETKEIMKRMDAANSAFYSLLPVFKSKNFYRETKIKLYKTLIPANGPPGGPALGDDARVPRTAALCTAPGRHLRYLRRRVGLPHLQGGGDDVRPLHLEVPLLLLVFCHALPGAGRST